MAAHDHLRSIEFDESSVPADIHYRELLGTERLSPLRLPTETELAAAARLSPLLAAARALALWVGDGRPVDDATGALSEEDTALAAKELSASGAVPVDVDPTPNEMAQWWELADDLEFLDIGERTVTVTSGVDAWPDGDDDTVLDMWKQAFASLCAWSLAVDAELAGEPHLRLHGAGATMLPLFAARESGLGLAELSAMVHEVAVIDADGELPAAAWERWVASQGDPAEVLYRRLALLGAVEIHDGTVRLTALGMFALWSEVRSEVDIPLLPAAEKMSAADMVSVALLGTIEQVDSEWQAWSATRTAADAATELAAVAMEGGPGERAAATALLHELGTDAHAVWHTLLDVPALRPYAKRALGESDASAKLELTDHDIAWLTADMFCDVDVEHPPDRIDDLLASTVGAGEEDMFEVLWRLEHPGAAAALRVFGQYHPDKRVAKAARRAAFKVERIG
ncbi:hypothetical protein [Saccharomonospora cyanea]|uniref:Uncharacterized protein n=1 Tax=Saccharomonospora cyanea NA-134 TaxID=882082 RepID=H5XR50_9PSEU|nr:hypothetical protein [Saccharomonospora cyanea]EHR62291.1 hypothetical protein SaccyDRAFT_3460 [Saccharomonospora cyanea NA-134]